MRRSLKTSVAFGASLILVAACGINSDGGDLSDQVAPGGAAGDQAAGANNSGGGSAAGHAGATIAGSGGALTAGHAGGSTVSGHAGTSAGGTTTTGGSAGHPSGGTTGAGTSATGGAGSSAGGAETAGKGGAESGGSGGAIAVGGAGTGGASAGASGEGGNGNAGVGGAETAGSGGSTIAGSGGSTIAGSGGSTTAGSGGTSSGGAGGATTAGSGGTSSGGASGAGGAPLTNFTIGGLDACHSLTDKDDNWDLVDTQFIGAFSGFSNGVLQLTDGGDNEVARSFWKTRSPDIPAGNTFVGELQYHFTHSGKDDHADGATFVWLAGDAVDVGTSGFTAGGVLGLPDAAGCAVVIDDYNGSGRAYPALNAVCDGSKVSSKANNETWLLPDISSPSPYENHATLRFRATRQSGGGSGFDLEIEALADPADGGAFVRSTGSIDWGSTSATWGVTASTGGSDQSTYVSSIKVAINGTCITH